MAQCYNKIYIKKYDIEVDCKKCLNCLENRKKEAAARILTENQNYINKYFVTLTYDPLLADYDKNGMTKLNKKHLKAYIESLQYRHKKHYLDDYGKANNNMLHIKCGEYGETRTQRAHYHVIIYSNIYIERYIKMNWKYGHVNMERIRDARAVAYTAGYTDKKYKKAIDNREIRPFISWSRGLGKRWIHEAIASGKVNEKDYYIENIIFKTRLPDYFKKEIKIAVMGVRPKYRKMNEKEKQEYYEAHGEYKKTIMVNRNEYDANYNKWEQFIEKVKEQARKRDKLYTHYEEMKKRHGKNWQQRIYDLLYNEKYDEMDQVEKEFIHYKKLLNEHIKILAKQKEYRKKGKRNKIA